MNKIKFLIKFIKLSKKRLDSDKDYYAFQEHQANGVYEDIDKILKIPKNSFVIDFGCGNGGYTNFLTKKYKQVLGIDFHVKPLKHDNKVNFENHNLLKYKSSKKADFVFCASVIEHVEDQEQFIKTISDNLKNNGSLYLSFPPFYSFVGGHQLKL